MAIHADRSRSEKQRETTAFLLSDYLRDEPDKLVSVILVADEFGEFSFLRDALRPHSAAVKEQLIAEMQAATHDEPSTQLRDAHWKRQSLAAVALLNLGYADPVWQLLEFTPNPSLRSFIIHHLGRLRTDHNILAARLQTESEVSIRRALIQSLGGLDPTIIPPTDRSRIAVQLQTLYLNNPDPGIHGSASWTLRQWGERLPELPVSKPTLIEQEEQRSWYVNPQGMTMVVIPIPSESGDNPIKHNLAISNYEVTVAQYRRLREQHDVIRDLAPTDDCPVHRVNWYMAAEYCNWLSQQEGISEDQWVYEPNDSGQYADGMKIKANSVELRGYRLPTAAEWEHACRSGTSGAFGFGAPPSLLRWYAHYVLNSNGRSHSVGTLLPNEAGLFDMHGNLWEWTQDAVSGPLSPVPINSRRVMRGGAFLGLSQSVHSTNRTAARPDNRVGSAGFRPVRTYSLVP